MTVQEWITNDKVIRNSKKAYAHFDYRTDISEKRAYVTDPQKVAHHGFYPFIHYEMVMYRYRKGNRTKKTRDICYAAHIDRCIFQYYGFILNELYNKRIRINGIENVAVAYRTDLHQTNIEFSKRAFDYINALKSAYVMIGDFTHFFDNLDHHYLKRQWCSLLGDEQLPEDHYNVFKHVTAYSKWELKDLSFMGHQDPLQYYQEASIFIMTSAFEGWPMTLMEAMPCGCVPIAFDSYSAVHDIIQSGRNGYVVPNDDIDEYVRVLKELMNNDTLRAELAANAQEDVQRFSRENIAKQWKTLLENL